VRTPNSRPAARRVRQCACRAGGARDTKRTKMPSGTNTLRSSRNPKTSYARRRRRAEDVEEVRSAARLLCDHPESGEEIGTRTPDRPSRKPRGNRTEAQPTAKRDGGQAPPLSNLNSSIPVDRGVPPRLSNHWYVDVGARRRCRDFFDATVISSTMRSTLTAACWPRRWTIAWLVVMATTPDRAGAPYGRHNPTAEEFFPPGNSPHNAAKADDARLDLRRLPDDARVALGEIGLDYH